MIICVHHRARSGRVAVCMSPVGLAVNSSLIVCSSLPNVDPLVKSYSEQVARVVEALGYIWWTGGRKCSGIFICMDVGHMWRSRFLTSMKPHYNKARVVKEIWGSLRCAGFLLFSFRGKRKSLKSEPVRRSWEWGKEEDWEREKETEKEGCPSAKHISAVETLCEETH